MKRFVLNPEDLTIETFTTMPEEAGRAGTVHAFADAADADVSPSCVPGPESCQENTCGNDYTCPYSCPWTCDDWSCFYTECDMTCWQQTCYPRTECPSGPCRCGGGIMTEMC